LSSDPTTTPRGWSALPVLTWAAVLLGIGAALVSAYQESVTVDEPLHMEWSRRLFETGVTERESDTYFESKQPFTLANVAARRIARYGFRVGDRQKLLFWSRVPTVLCFGVLLGGVFLIGRRWLGATAAQLATIGCALDANLIAHAGLTTVDVPYAAFHLFVLAAVYELARRPSLARGLVLGAWFGVAFATKFTAALLLPGAAFALLARDARPSRDDLRRGVLGLLAAAAAAALVISAGYLFIQVGEPLSATRWRSQPMLRLSAWLPQLRLPLPTDFLTGFDLSLGRERDVRWSVVILSRPYPNGVFFYFPLLWLWKTPLSLLAGQLLGGFWAIRHGLLWRVPALRLLALNLALAAGYFCFVFQAQNGFRYVLMCLPIGYLIAAAGLARLPARRATVLAGLGAFLLAIAENAAYAGNHLAFTNLTVQPKRLAFRWLTHSNLDWRQNEYQVDAHLASAGLGRSRLDPPHILPGKNLLRSTHVDGSLRFERYRWVRENLEPVRHFSHTFLLFDVSADAFSRFLGERRRVPATSAAEPCPAGEPQVLAPGHALALEQSGRRKRLLMCVLSDGGVDLGLRVTSGAVVFGPEVWQPEAREFVERDQELWYRLEPGRHAFVAAVPEAFAAVLEARSGNATVRFEGASRD